MYNSKCWSDDRFVDVLVAFDELLASCGSESWLLDDLEFDFAPGIERQRLARCANCLRLIKSVWPGASGSNGPVSGLPGDSTVAILRGNRADNDR